MYARIHICTYILIGFACTDIAGLDPWTAADVCSADGSSSNGEAAISCDYANNGWCDEPWLCNPGTDTNDCSQGYLSKEWCMFASTYIHLHVFTCSYIHTYTYIHTYMCIYVINVHIFIHMYICEHIYTIYSSDRETGQSSSILPM